MGCGSSKTVTDVRSSLVNDDGVRKVNNTKPEYKETKVSQPHETKIEHTAVAHTTIQETLTIPRGAEEVDASIKEDPPASPPALSGRGPSLTSDPHSQAIVDGSGEATRHTIPAHVENTTPQAKSLTPAMQSVDVDPEIPAYNEESLRLAQQLVDKHSELQTGFSDINAFVKVLEDDPNVEGNLEQVSELLTKVVGPSYVNRNESHRGIFAEYLSYIRLAEAVFNVYIHFLHGKGLENLTGSIAKEHLSNTEYGFVRFLRTLLWNYTDASLAFAERVCDCGILRCFVGDLKLILEEAGDSSQVSSSDKFFRSARGILHNCSMNPITLQTIRKLGTVSVSLAYLKGDAPVIKMTMLLILANIIDEEDNKYLLADDMVFTLMLRIIQKAMTKSRHRYDGFSVTELIVGVTGLAKNDENKKILTSKGATPVLMAILKEGSEQEQEKAALCVWELAFDKDNQKSFLENDELILVLKDLTGSLDRKISKAATGALWVIQQEEKKDKEGRHTPDQLASRSARGHVMLSYQWADQKVVIKVKEHLRHHGYTVWMDIDNMEGSTLQAMAEAVQNSAVILVCMTERYKLSQNCRSEAEYAFDLRKEIVPLIMQRGYKPDGWLGMIKGAKLFFDFSGKYPFEQKATELTKELGERGKVLAEDTIDGQTGVVVQAVPADAGRGASSVAGWSNNDVYNWLSQLGMEKRKTLNTLTGKQLSFLHKLSYKAPEFFYGYAKSDLQLCNLEDLMNFTEAVEALK